MKTFLERPDKMTLEIKNLTGGYSQLPVLHQVSFTVAAGELVGLIGLNGAGKSTTLNHIIGLMRPFQRTDYLKRDRASHRSGCV